MDHRPVTDPTPFFRMPRTGDAKRIADQIRHAQTLDELLAIERQHNPTSINKEDGAAISRLFGERWAELKQGGAAAPSS